MPTWLIVPGYPYWPVLPAMATLVSEPLPSMPQATLARPSALVLVPQPTWFARVKLSSTVLVVGVGVGVGVVVVVGVAVAVSVALSLRVALPICPHPVARP